jgi:(R,R)-butanediol dehydrogenase/meso-butanediol dehydrogenase/diacetyl reductase
MRAAVYKGNHTITVEDVPVPPVGPQQVLLEVSHCGICGSDLHLMMEDWGRPDTTGGHEYSGVVAAVGDAVKGWTLGDRAVGGPGPGCGSCHHCAAGRTNLCQRRSNAGIDPFTGAFANYKVVDAAKLFRLPDPLDLRSAALTEPVAVALRGVRRSGVAPGDRALVTGAGPIGLLTIAVLRAWGIDDITVSEPGPKRRALAERIGAARVVRPDELEQKPMPMQVLDDAYRVAFDCSGRADAMEQALGSLDRAGVLVLSGTGMRKPRFDPNRIILNELVVTGSVEYTRQDYDDAIELLASGSLPVAELIEPEDQPLDRLQWAMEQLMAGELAGKVMVAPTA